MHFTSLSRYSSHRRRLERRTAVLLAIVLPGGCVLAPAGLDEERDRLDQTGQTFETPIEQRNVPELPLEPTWREVLQRAFLANGELEAAYFEWRAAVERVEIAAGWPNTDLMPSFSYMLSGDSMTAWDRTTVTLAFDGSENLQLPVKTRKAAELALESARAAGERFRAAKFALQRRVLDGWLDVALAEELLRIARADLELTRVVASTAGPRVETGGPQQDLIRAQVEVREAENRVLGLEAEARALRARLNGVLAREPDAPLAFGDALPEPRSVPSDDATLLALGVDGNPDLAGLAREVAGREDALELAKLMYLPDFDPFAGFTGSVSQMVGFAVMLPTTLPEIRGGIAEAEAMLSGARALARQTRSDRAASFVAALVVLRDSEREVAFLGRSVLPAAELVVETTRQSYGVGSASLVDLVEAQQMLLDVRSAIGATRIERERRIAEIEELAGVDLEPVARAEGIDGTEDEIHVRE